MKGSEFLHRLKRYGRSRGLDVRLDEKRGKGSHATVYLGERYTVLKDRRKELGKGLLRAMLSNLGVDPEEF
ncbi:MAG: type II toxin-antitoxin system HicA family toxin [Pseudomonadota bacterium]